MPISCTRSRFSGLCYYSWRCVYGERQGCYHRGLASPQIRSRYPSLSRIRQFLPSLHSSVLPCRSADYLSPSKDDKSLRVDVRSPSGLRASKAPFYRSSNSPTFRSRLTCFLVHRRLWLRHVGNPLPKARWSAPSRRFLVSQVQSG